MLLGVHGLYPPYGTSSFFVRAESKAGIFLVGKKDSCLPFPANPKESASLASFALWLQNQIAQEPASLTLMNYELFSDFAQYKYALLILN